LGADLVPSDRDLTPVDESSSNAAKLEFLGTLFSGRRDVYALRWESASRTKAGRSPAVLGGWQRAKTSKHREYLPLTEDVLAAHLRGEATVDLRPARLTARQR
jgi:hypothetical protein